MPGWGVGDLLKDIELDPLTKGMIVQLNHVNDAELLRLYESSMFCVFPSLYEGWGLPVGEALSLGKAVLCSIEYPCRRSVVIWCVMLIHGVRVLGRMRYSGWRR